MSDISSKQLPEFEASVNYKLSEIISTNLTNTEATDKFPSLMHVINDTKSFQTSQNINFNNLSNNINQCNQETNSQLENISQQSEIILNEGNASTDFKNTHCEQVQALTTKIDDIRTTVKDYTFQTYQKTGQTPLKQDPIYPTNFIESKPFSHLINEFNQSLENNNNNNGNGNKENNSGGINGSAGCKDLPYEVEINFTDEKLGIQICSNNQRNPKNAFVRSCSSDCRVANGAQIIAIDGISVVNKTINYIKTLLSTKQRPLSIKFRNVCLTKNKKLD